MIGNKQLCIVGAGSVAEALISGILAKKQLLPENITVINKSNNERVHYLVNKYHVQKALNKGQAIARTDILILAFKPADVIEGMKHIHPYTNKKQLTISVIAGLSTDAISDLLRHDGPVIRTMPNTSAMIGLSATAISKGQFAEDTDLEIAKLLLEAIGTVTIVEEKLLNAVTGLSGSGPAYIYYLVEAMESAAIDLGIKQETARELIIQTIIGAGHMLKETAEEPAILRKNVTSPGGSTMAGLNVLEKKHFQAAMQQAIISATIRSQEMGNILASSTKL